jgi:hypothetical protein
MTVSEFSDAPASFIYHAWDINCRCSISTQCSSTKGWLLSFTIFWGDIIFSFFGRILEELSLSVATLPYRRGFAGFLWYLYYLCGIYLSILGFCDTLVSSEYISQIIWNILQIYNLMNLKFDLLCTWIRGYDGFIIPIYFLTFWMVHIMSL